MISFSFKLNFEYTRGEEFDFADSVYLNRNGERVAEEEIDLDNEFEFIKGGGSVYYTVNEDSDFDFPPMMVVTVHTWPPQMLVETRLSTGESRPFIYDTLHPDYLLKHI